MDTVGPSRHPAVGSSASQKPITDRSDAGNENVEFDLAASDLGTVEALEQRMHEALDHVEVIELDPSPVISSAPAKEHIIGQRVDAITLSNAVDDITARSLSGEVGAYVCCTNVHATVEGLRDPEVQEAAEAAFLSVPDGMPLVWVLRRRGYDVERVTGMDLALAVAEAGVPSGIRHFFMGGAPGVADRAAEAIAEQVPGVVIAGSYSPPFADDGGTELAELKAMVAEVHPHVIWVALGCPKQELWMARNAAFLGVPVLVGIGAAFDFLAGDKKRAPKWMGEAGLEWLFRLVSEPRRLWKRYLIGNSVFLIALATEGLRKALRIRGRARTAS